MQDTWWLSMHSVLFQCPRTNNSFDIPTSNYRRLLLPKKLVFVLCVVVVLGRAFSLWSRSLVQS